MGTVASRFVEEAVFGISCRGSVQFTEIGPALEETNSLHATHKRLRRNLADESLELNLDRNVLKLGSKRINENTLLIVDPFDIKKKYSQKMQYLSGLLKGRGTPEGTNRQLRLSYPYGEKMSELLHSSPLTTRPPLVNLPLSDCTRCSINLSVFLVTSSCEGEAPSS